MDYGDYVRRTKYPDPYYMSRLECRHPDGEPPDVTSKARPDQGPSFPTAREQKGDAIIVELGSNFDPETLQIQAHPHQLDQSCACVHPAEYFYHQGSCCRHCGGLIIGEPDCQEQLHNACNLHQLGQLGHGKDGSVDPNCVICSLPRNKAVKPSS